MLDNLPAELRRDASPAFCTCSSCEPLMSAVERKQHQAVSKAWNAARRNWCASSGYGLAELLVAEHGRRAPSKRRPGTNPTNRAATADPGKASSTNEGEPHDNL